MTSLTPVGSAIGWSSPESDGTGINSWYNYSTMLMPNGNVYDTFIVVHPFLTANQPAYKTYALNGQYHTFTAILGNARYGDIDDVCINTGNGSYTMSILVDGRIEYRKTGWAPIQTYYEHVIIDVSGAMTLRIETTHNNSYVCDFPVFAQPILCDATTYLTQSQSTECDLGSINVGEDIECTLNVTYPDIVISETTRLTVINSFNIIDSIGLNASCMNPRISYLSNGNDEYISIYEGNNTSELISTCDGIASMTFVSSLDFNSGLDVTYSTTADGVGYYLSSGCTWPIESFTSGGLSTDSCSFTINEGYQVDSGLTITSITVFYQYFTGFAWPYGPITSAGTPTKVFLVIRDKDDSTKFWRSQFPELDDPNYWFHAGEGWGCIDVVSPLQITEFIIPLNVTLKGKNIEFAFEFDNDQRNLFIMQDTFRININYVNETVVVCNLNSCLNNYQLRNDYNDSNVIDISIHVSKREESTDITSAFNDVCLRDDLIDSTITLICQRSAPTIQPTTSPSFEPTINPTIDPTSDPTANPTHKPTADPTGNHHDQVS